MESINWNFCIGVVMGGIFPLVSMWLTFIIVRSAYTNTPLIDKDVELEPEEEYLPETTEEREDRESKEFSERMSHL